MAVLRSWKVASNGDFGSKPPRQVSTTLKLVGPIGYGEISALISVVDDESLSSSKLAWLIEGQSPFSL